MRKKGFQLIAACCAFLLFLSPVAEVAAADMTEAVREKQALQSELDEAKELIRDLESGKKDVESYVVALDQKLNELSQKISNLEKELQNKEVKIQDTQDALAQAEQDVSQQQGDMSKRIQFLYEQSGASFLDMLLAAESLGDMLNTAVYFAELSRYDRQMMDKYKATVEAVADLEHSLEDELASLAAMQADLEKEQEAVALLIGAKEKEIIEYGEDIADTQEQTEMLESEIKAQDEMIAMIRVLEEQRKAAEEEARIQEEARVKAAEEAARIAAQQEEARRKAEEEAARRKEEESGGEPEEGEGTPTEVTPEEPEPQKPTPPPVPPAPPTPPPGYEGGRFLWPVPASNRITSEFGPRPSPTPGASSVHQGIDIGAPSGTSIVAAATGKVAVAAYSSSAGNYIMLDHGKGLYTVYMHCSSLGVSAGQVVEAGQSIAKVGSTGISTGPHLHFGVSLNGAYVSPWNYL